MTNFLQILYRSSYQEGVVLGKTHQISGWLTSVTLFFKTALTFLEVLEMSMEDQIHA